MNKKVKDPVEFTLGDVNIYIVETGIDVEFPDEESPRINAVCCVSLEVVDSIKLAKAILEYYKED